MQLSIATAAVPSLRAMAPRRSLPSTSPNPIRPARHRLDPGPDGRRRRRFHVGYRQRSTCTRQDGPDGTLFISWPG
jgi:hypothetical protein